ncbi:MAG: hypothetical protein ABI389_06575 [Rhodanobacter sp.]
MKRFQSLCMLLVLAATATCQSHPVTDQSPGIPAQDAVTNADPLAKAFATRSTQPITQAPTTAITQIPKSFSKYASESVGNGKRCIVGAVTDADGMNERAVVHLDDATDTRPTWVHRLNLPPHTYQSRATHCTYSGHSLYVLLQSDTQPEQTLSQTILSVAKLDPATGTVQIQRNIQVPGAFSAWVDWGPDHFQGKGDALIVSGNNRPQSSPDQPTTFIVHVNSHLVSVKED